MDGRRLAAAGHYNMKTQNNPSGSFRNEVHNREFCRRAYGKISRVDILSDLNPQQRQAVTAGIGPTLVLAGPGSGKTRVLTNRIAYVINNLGVRPHHILAVTFTNKAAREMEARVKKVLEQDLKGIWLGTFHAICARILRRETDLLPFDSNFVIYDDDDQQTLVKRAIKDLNLDEKIYRPNSVHAAISTAKNNLIFPQNFSTKTYRDEVIGRVYKRYNELLVNNNAVDFDDLLLWTWRLLEENLEAREKYGRRFEYILVDEFQDTNLVQYELLRHLASYNQNIFVVGDEDQSIYRWRGADYRNVMRFEEDYPKAQKILLEQNYRSTQTVLDAAVSVIGRNHHRTPKRLRSLPDHGKGDKIVLYEAVDDHAEAAYVVDTIQQINSTSQYRGGDIAVMYRTNAQSRLVEEAFLRSGMPYRLVGAQRFYGRREIKDMISYLRLVQNPADEVSLGRIINVPPRGIGDKTLVALQLAAQKAEISAGEVLLDLGRQGKDSPHWAILARGATLLADFGTLLVSWVEHLESMPLPELFDRILEDTVYYEHVSDGTEEGRSRWENVQELRRLAYEYDDRGLSSFLENLALVSDQDTVPEEAEAPTLLTLHAAKGLEFPVVFILGLDDGVLPHSRSLDDPEEMAEERRLFYVGLTRAKYRLYLVRAEQRSMYGSYQESIPSRFLEDIPEDLVRAATKRRRESGVAARRSSASDWNESRDQRTLRTPPRATAAPIIQARYAPMMRVNHPTWGEGIVQESKMLDGEEMVVVQFDTVGLKRLDAALANLQILPGKEK
jgi:DNA helicase II / ATP-dependent DNA helicase PcrA